MSRGKKYKIPHKYLRKYQRGTWHRYKVMGGKNGEKAKFKYFRHKKLWKTLEEVKQVAERKRRNIFPLSSELDNKITL